MQATLVNGFVRQGIRPLIPALKRDEQTAVTEMIDAGKLSPVLDRAYPLADTAEGLRYVEQGHARGKVIVQAA